jgi:glycosyltransferase involved in cell wall biosynthesis
VIPNPMAVDAGLKLWNLDDCDPKTILFVGRFDKLKGGDTALIAFKRLLEFDENLKMIFVGPDRGLLSASGLRISFDKFSASLFSKGQRQNIRYLGTLPRSEIEALRRIAMVSIVVSRWENQPNTALEAMIQGCPIVAFDTGGMSEIIENEVTGLLARPNDIEDLCGKIMSLLADYEKARRMGERARRFVIDRHSVKKLAAETVDTYREAIAMARANAN